MKNIQISDIADQNLHKMKARLNRPKKQIIEQLIYYAYKLHIDPENIKEGNPIEAVLKLKNTIVGFIKTQEKEKLNPLVQMIGQSVAKVNAMVDDVPTKTQMAGRLKKTDEQFGFIKSVSDSIFSDISELKRHLQMYFKEKENYKARAVLLVKNYINERESMGALSSSKKKEELQFRLMEELESL